MSEPRSVLLLCDESRQHAANVLQHIEAFERFSRHRIYKFNPVERPAASAMLDLDEFDVVAIHYTIFVILDRYLPRALVDKIARFEGLKVQFIQDEYRRVDAITERMRELGIDVLFTCVPPDQAEAVYGPRLPGVKTVTTLPGYVPDELVGRGALPLESRLLDVAFRARDLPYWLGELGREKVEIGRGFLQHAESYGLRCDISWEESDRIYGEAWNRFLGSARATLGTESGASIVDFDGTIELRVRDYLVAHPEASYDAVEQSILAPYEGGPRINTASPRLFEATALRTGLILFPGYYSGTVEPWEHYIPLARDFSNFDEVAEKLRDDSFLAEMTERAYDHLIASRRYSLDSFIRDVDAVVDERAAGRAGPGKSRFVRAKIRRRMPSLLRPSKLRVFFGRIATPPMKTSVVTRDPAVRRLALQWLRDPELRAAIPWRRAAGDLWKLAALRRLARKRDAYHVLAQVEAETRQVIFSSRLGPNNGTQQSVEVQEPVERIVWNHSAVGESIPLLGSSLVPAPVGKHGIQGAHSFEGLVALGRKYPRLVLDALAPLVGAQPPSTEHSRTPL